MKQVTLILLAILALSSCKQDDPPAPESKNGSLIIEWKTSDPAMQIYKKIGNQSTIYIETINSNYHKYEATVKGDQTVVASIDPSNDNSSSILIKFNGDTLGYKTGSVFNLSVSLPFVK